MTDEAAVPEKKEDIEIEEVEIPSEKFVVTLEVYCDTREDAVGWLENLLEEAPEIKSYQIEE